MWWCCDDVDGGGGAGGGLTARRCCRLFVFVMMSVRSSCSDMERGMEKTPGTICSVERVGTSPSCVVACQGGGRSTDGNSRWLQAAGCGIPLLCNSYRSYIRAALDFSRETVCTGALQHLSDALVHGTFTGQMGRPNGPQARTQHSWALQTLMVSNIRLAGVHQRESGLWTHCDTDRQMPSKPHTSIS